MSKDKKKVTIREIAKEANVSVGTVSNVLNKKDIVSEKLKQRINKTIMKYNYKIDFSASGLRGKTSKLFGVIVPDNANPIFSVISYHIECLAKENGYNIVICNSNYNYKKEIEYIEILKSRNVDGIIIYPSIENKGSFNILNKYKINSVLIERKINCINTDVIMLDHYTAMAKVVNYLASLNHKKIAYIDRESYFYRSRERYKGFIAGLERNNLKLIKELIINGEELSMKSGYRDAKTILEKGIKPTAIVVYNDVMAIGAIRAVKDMNLLIPQDISIIGYDNIIYNDFLETKLTSVTSEKKKVAYWSVKLLLDRIKNEDKEFKNIIILPKLRIRESSGIAKL